MYWHKGFPWYWRRAESLQSQTESGEVLTAPSAPQEPEREREKVSYDWIRQKLEQAFQELMETIPQGQDEALIADYLFQDQWHSLKTERTPLKLLRDFATAVLNLQGVRGSSREEIQRILQADVAQAVLMEEKWWVQKYLD